MPTPPPRPDITALLNEAFAQQQAGRMDEAGNLYLRVLAIEPNQPYALHMLGVVLFATDQVDRALHMLRRAQALSGENAELCNNLGAALHQLGRLDEAIAQFDRALALEPASGFAWSNRALALHQARRFAEALESYAQAMRLQPDNTRLRWHAAFTHLQLGDYATGWAEYEWRWLDVKDHPAVTRDRRWTGAEPVEGRVVLLVGEQGYGDVLQFCRYAPLLAGRGAEVVVAVAAPLVRLLSRMPAVTVIDIEGPIPDFDLQCPMLSLPLAFGTTLDTIPSDSPYLTANREQAAGWRARLAGLPGLKVGLVWSGAPRPNLSEAHRIDRRRSMRLAQLAPLAAVAGISFISLQKGPPAAEAATPPDGMVLHDWTDELHDFADTAALVAGLDLLISVDTAMAHLGGALAVPTWVMNRHDTCWRWLHGRDDSPWYPSMRLFTQPGPGDWPDVVARVAAALQAMG